jgi:peptide/nickel transport system substrate-binding protein
METLLKEASDGKLTEQLASMEYKADPPTIIWHVRKGVKFSDGTDLNAQALKWNMQKQIDSKLYASVSYYKSLDVIDDYTLSVPMTMSRNSIFPAFAKYQNYMVSPTAYEKNGVDWLREHIVGTGAYLQTDFQRDVSFSAKRNPNYWDAGKPYLDTIKHVFVKDPMTQRALFASSSGQAVILNSTANPLTASQLAAQGYNIITQPADSMSLMPDSANADSPYSKIQVRQAVEYALDKEGIAKTFGLGFWKAATQPASPDAPAYVPTITGRKYDVARAKALLTEAGYADGFTTRIIALDTMDRNVLQAIQANLAAVKIKVEIEFITPAKQADYLAKGWKNALLWNATPFEGSILATIGYNFPPGRTSRYTVLKDAPGWKAAYDEIGTGPIVPEKTSMQKASQVIYDDATFIPIYWESSLWVVSDKVHDTGLGTRAPGSSASPSIWDTGLVWVSK